MQATIYSGKSKKGKDYEGLRIKIGEYETLIFPTKIELLYIKSFLKQQAHKDFKGDDLDIEEK